MSDVDVTVTASMTHVSQLLGPASDSIGVACTLCSAHLFAGPVTESLGPDDFVSGSLELGDFRSARRFSGIGVDL